MLEVDYQACQQAVQEHYAANQQDLFLLGTLLLLLGLTSVATPKELKEAEFRIRMCRHLIPDVFPTEDKVTWTLQEIRKTQGIRVNCATTPRGRWIRQRVKLLATDVAREAHG